MTINQLRYFVTLASTKSFSQTAVLEFTTQPNVSKCIKNLEEEIGFSLFTRNNRNIELTEAGKMLLPEAKAIIKRIDGAVERISRLFASEHATIRVLSLPFTSQYGLHAIFKKYSDENTGVNIEIEELEERELMESFALANGDIYLLREITATDNNLVYKTLIQDEISLFVSNNHPLAKNQSVSMEQLSNERFMWLPKDSGAHKLCMQGCLSAGFTPNVKTSHRIENIISQVSVGRVSALLPSSNKNSFKLKDINVIPVQPIISCNIVAVLAPNLGDKPNKNYCKKLVSYIKENAE